MLLILQKLLEIEPTFVTGRQRIRRKKLQFNYKTPDEVIQDPEEKFKVDFFYSVLDTAKNSIEERSQQLEQYNTIFGFLYDIHGIKETCTDLLNACKQLEKSLTQNKDKDIEAEDLHYEIKAIARRLPMSMPPQNVLQFILQQNLRIMCPISL